MSRQYKNVYTILEKVKKGEIQSYYNMDDDGLFGKINFYKKSDLIKPYMHYIDERKVDTVIDTYISNGDVLSEAYHKLNKMAPDQRPDMAAFAQKVKETYRKFPKHLSKDIQKMFYRLRLRLTDILFQWQKQQRPLEMQHMLPRTLRRP